MCSATIKRFEDEGRQAEDLPLLMWAIHDSFFKLQVAMDGVLANFPNRFIAAVLRLLVFPKGLTLDAPSDRIGSKVAEILITPGAARDRLTKGAYIPRREDDTVGRLEFAMEAAVAAEPIEAKLRRAQKEGKLPQRSPAERRDAAVAQGLLTQAERQQLETADRLRQEVIHVDDFVHDLGRNAQAQQEEAWPETRKRAVAASI
jgi:acyl-CoA dehydrogenase